MKTLLLLVSISALGLIAFAQDTTYQGWMKTVASTGGSLRKNLAAKDGAGAASDAKKLHEVFVQVHDYWNKKGTEDAMKFAMTASEAYGEVAEFATAGKFDEAAASATKASATCAGCHQAHREKAPDGSWKMK